MMDFPAFQASDAAQLMFRKLGFEDFLTAATSWRMLRALVVQHNDKTERGCFVEAARHVEGVCSSGERILLHAICTALDFAWLADEFADGKAWRNMDRVSGQHLDAVAACLVRADRRVVSSDAVAEWMMRNGYATGHGDTIEDMLVELEGQAHLRGRQRAAS